ncbi:MAG: 7TM diverse intracellular signaling domain-containing protein [Bdellovibrionota bacterium]|nr:7TM diverse intracellular signaling domain-containing protein [Bdellovibrionota bacterium]
MKSLKRLISLLLFTSFAFADVPPVVLEDGKEFYEIGLNLELLEDPSGKLTIEDINRPEWTKKFKKSTKKAPKLPFSKSAFWAKVRIQNKTSDQRVWIISQNFTAQNYIIFFKKVNGSWKALTTGDFTPFKTREIKDKTLSFKIKPMANTLYIFRIEGNSNIFDLSLSSPLNFVQNRTRENLVSGLFFGLVMAMVLYNFFILITTKNLSYLYYTFYVLFWGMTLFIHQGFAQRFLAPNSIWLGGNGTTFFVALTLLFITLFTISFLKLKESTPKLYKGAQFFALTSFLVTLCSFIFPYSINAKVHTFSGILCSSYIFFCGIYRFKMNYRPAKYFLLAFSFMILGVLTFISTYVGVLPLNIFTSQSIFIGNALQLILLSIGLGDSFNLIQEENLKLQENYAKDLKVEVNQKTKSIKGLVENLGQGFMVMDKSGVIQEGATQITKDFFNTDPEGQKLSDVLQLEGEKREVFDKWLKNIWRGILTFRDLRQLGPQSFEGSHGRYIDLDYKAIYVEDQKRKVDKVICVATDKTQEIVLERKLELDKQKAEFITTCLQNPVEFVDLMDDTYDLLETYPKIKNHDQGELFRKFHTLKARYGQFGVKALTYYINEVETGISKGQLDNLDSKVSCFEKELQDFVKKNRLIIEAANKFMVDNGHAVQVSEMMEKIKNSESLDDLKFDLYKNYLLSDIKEKFERYKPLVDELAEKQSKVIDVNFLGDKVLVEYAKFSNFVNVSIHLFRNMVDHGIETEDERIEKTKPQRGSIKVEFKNEGDSFSINLKDDGGGIDPQRIKDKVLEKALSRKRNLKTLKIQILLI